MTSSRKTLFSDQKIRYLFYKDVHLEEMLLRETCLNFKIERLYKSVMVHLI